MLSYLKSLFTAAHAKSATFQLVAVGVPGGNRVVGTFEGTLESAKRAAMAHSVRTGFRVIAA